MLELLVSHHREPADVVARLLSSVDAQRGVDPSRVRVTICNDGHERPLPEGIERGHPYEVRYFEAERGGVSHTRNALLDAATGDYLMFCDCDDLLAGPGSLRRTIELCEGVDVAVPAFLKETEGGGLVTEDSNVQMIQGKAFRRRYLADNGIRFCDDLVESGDPYFTWQAALLTQRKRFAHDATYIWAYNEGSVCRGEEDHFHRNFWCVVEREGLLADRFERLGMAERARFFAQRLVTQSYLVMHQDRWHAHEHEFRCRLAVRRLSWWLARHYGAYLSVGERRRRRHYECAAALYGGGPDAGFGGIDGWAREIMETDERFEDMR